MRPRPIMRPESKASTVAISLISAIIGALASQTLDFVKTRQLKVEEQRVAAEDRAWIESGEMYRQLYAMRGRLTGSLDRHHFAVIEKEYAKARAAITRIPQVPAAAAELDKRVQDAIQQALHDRAELELLLGWADLVAPENDKRWSDAIGALVRLNPWSPRTPSARSVAELDRWRTTEVSRAQNARTTELKVKFAALLALIREERKHVIITRAVSVRSPI